MKKTNINRKNHQKNESIRHEKKKKQKSIERTTEKNKNIPPQKKHHPLYFQRAQVSIKKKKKTPVAIEQRWGIFIYTY